jgi:hypothetical protein
MEPFMEALSIVQQESNALQRAFGVPFTFL